MHRLLLLLCVGLFAVMTVAVLGYQRFGLPGLLGAFGLVVVGLWGLKWLGGRLVRGAILGMFQAKSAALRGARLSVLGVAAAPAPARGGGDEEGGDEEGGDEEGGDEGADDAEGDEPPRRWFHVELEIAPDGAPDGAPGGFQHWEPGELVLVPRGAPGLLEEDPEEGPEERPDPCRIHDLQVWRDGAWAADEEGKYAGPQRLRLHVGALPGAGPLELRYYFERLGPVDLAGS